MRRVTRLEILVVAAISLSMLAGCVTTGTGTRAGYTDTRTGFLYNYDNLKEGEGIGVPDYYYASPDANLAEYKNVLVSDFASVSTEDLSGLRIDYYKNISNDLARSIAQALDGNMFDRCEATNRKIRHNDLDEIKRLPADAVILGNFVEFKQNIGLGILAEAKRTEDFPTTTKVEIKIVDTRTGEEVVSVVDEKTTDADKVAMAVVRRLTNLLRKIQTVAKPAASTAAISQPASQTHRERTCRPGRAAARVNHGCSRFGRGRRSGGQGMQAANRLVVGTANAKVRQSPSKKARVVKQLNNGDKVELVKEKGEWCLVECPDGTTGWAHKSLFEQN